MPAYKKIHVGIYNTELNALEDILFAELSEEERQENVAIVKKLWLRLVKKYDDKPIEKDKQV
jgi:hypothetical protein